MSEVFVHQAVRAVGLVVLCALAGFPLARLAPVDLRRPALLAAPVGGAAALVVLEQWVGVVWPMRTGAWAIIAVIAASIGVSLWVRRDGIASDVRALLAGLALCAVALPGVVGVWNAHRHAEVGGLRFATANHDGYYFDATADWVLENTIFDVPTVGTSADDADTPAVSVVEQYEPIRKWGEQTLQALPAALLGGEVSAHWNVVSSAWLFFVPGALLLLGVGVGLRRPTWSAAIAGFVVTTSGGVLYSVHNQNSPLILGVPVALAAVAWLAVVLRSPERPSRWVYAAAAVAIAAWVGTYYELAVVVAPLVVGLVLAERVPFARLVRRTAIVVGVALVACPVAFLDLAHGATTVAGASSVWPDRYGDVAGWTIAGRIVGLSPLDPVPIGALPGYRWAVAIVLAGWVVVVAILAVHQRRIGLALLVLTLVAGAYWYMSGRGDAHYIANRVVLMWAVFAGGLAVLGAADWMLRSRSWLLVPFGAFAALSAFGGIKVAVDVGAYHVAFRSATAQDAEAARWVADAEVDGQRVAVATPNYVDQLVMMDMLRSDDGTDWLGMFTDYATVPYYVDDAPAANVLTPATSVSSDPAAFIRGNAGWALARLDPASVVVGADPGSAIVDDQVLTATGPSVRLNATNGSACASWEADVALPGIRDAVDVPLTAGRDLNAGAGSVVALGAAPRTVRFTPVAPGEVLRFDLPPGASELSIGNPRCVALAR
ncbi:MAG: hypothetical protein ABWZ42_09080 [Ilumatobacteraceae bacterium]